MAKKDIEQDDEQRVQKKYPTFATDIARGRAGLPANLGATLGDGSHKVIVHRYRDEFSLVGAPIIVRPLDEMVHALAKSGFMDEWIEGQIRQALESGREFSYMSQTMGTPKHVYRMCTDEDIRKLANDGQLQQAMTRPGEISETGRTKSSGPRKSRSCYRVAKPGKGDAEIVAGLQKGARTILGFMRAHVGPDGGEITGTELRMLLDGKKTTGEFVTKMDVMKLFAFHMSQTFKKLEPPLVEYVTATDDGEDDGVPTEDEDDE
jgi:hypothetical protein